MKKIVYNAEFGQFRLSVHALALLALSGFPMASRSLAQVGLAETAFTRAGPMGLRAHATRPWVLYEGLVYDDSSLRALDPKGLALRSHPVLVAVVELLGEAANGEDATLRIATVATDAVYRITDFDGLESVEVLKPSDFVTGHEFTRIDLAQFLASVTGTAPGAAEQLYS